jgi:hypothetical protein
MASIADYLAAHPKACKAIALSAGGASLGSLFPVIGTVVGGVAGIIVGIAINVDLGKITEAKKLEATLAPAQRQSALAILMEAAPKMVEVTQNPEFVRGVVQIMLAQAAKGDRKG